MTVGDDGFDPGITFLEEKPKIVNLKEASTLIWEMSQAFKMAVKRLELENNKLRIELDSNRIEIAALKAKVEDNEKASEKKLASYADIAKTNLKNSRMQVFEIVKSKEIRDKNVVMHGIASEVGDEAVKENVIEIVEACGGSRENVVAITKIGRIPEAGKSRPIKVILDEKKSRDDLVISASRLKGTKFDRIYINPDRSKEERQAIADLIKEAKRRNELDDSGNGNAGRKVWHVVGKLSPKLTERKDSPDRVET